VAYAVAEDNLRLGRDVIGNCVNPWMLTRNAWRDVGLRACAPVIEVEVTCSDREEHQRRIATRSADIEGLELPDCAAVTARDYHPWDRSPLVVDTARQSVAACTKRILSVAQALLPGIPGPPIIE
jgi:predicted kinase